MVLYTLLQQYNLYLQILALAIAFVSLILKTQKKLRLHGITMLTAVALHLFSVITVMIPSYINVLPLIAENPSNTLYITLLLHGIIGITTIVLAVWILASWRLRQSLKYCTPKKNAMRITLTLWMLTVIIAVLLYAA